MCEDGRESRQREQQEQRPVHFIRTPSGWRELPEQQQWDVGDSHPQPTQGCPPYPDHRQHFLHPSHLGRQSWEGLGPSPSTGESTDWGQGQDENR